MAGKNDIGVEKASAFQTLRKRAEETLAAGDRSLKDMSASEMSKLIHELHIHQVELEMQNEELRKSQAEIERSRRAYQDLWELSPVGYLIVDAVGRVSAVNRAGRRLLGKPENALLTERFAALVAPENQVPVHLMLERAAETGIAEQQEIRIKKPDGAVHICLLEVRSLEGEPGQKQIQAVLTDITQHKRAEDDLRKNEQEKKGILDSLIEHVIYHDRKMNILWANNAACKSVGMKREDLLERKCHEVWANRRTPCEDCPVTKTRDTGQSQMVEKMTPDGRWWHIKGHPVRDKSGRVTGMTELALDITERKRAEEALRNAKDELETKVKERTAELIAANKKLKQEIKIRKKVEKELQASENLLSTTFDTLQDLVVVIDKDLRVVMSNWKDHDYISEKDRQGHPFCYEVFTNSNKPCGPCHALEVFATGEATQHEATNPIDGKVRDIRVLPMFDDKGEVITVIEHLRDITGRKQAEAALQDSESRFRELFNNMRNGVAVYQAVDDGKDFIFVDFNSAGERIGNIKKEDLIGKSLSEVFPGVKEYGLFDVLQRVWKTGKPEHHPLSFYQDDRVSGWQENYVYRLPSGEIVSVFEDITDRKQMEQSLRESQQRFKSIFENAPIGFYRTSPDGRILDANPALLQILGYASFEELAAINLEAHDYHPEYSRRQFKERIERDGQIMGMEALWKRQDGTYRHIRENARIVRDANGEIVCYEGTVEDISEQKQAADQIRNLSQQLIQAQEDERQMISRELHDSVAQDLSSLLIGLNILSDHQINAIPEVRKKALELSEILRGTIEVVRDLSYELRPPGLDDIGLISALSMYCQEFAEKSGLKVDFQATGMSDMKLDVNTEMNLYRLIQEGLNNTRKHAAASQATVKLIGTYPNIILRIEDNGKGFDVEERARAADSERRMGLSSMAERVNLIRGRMAIQSQPMKGTRIFIKFPCQEKKDD